MSLRNFLLSDKIKAGLISQILQAKHKYTNISQRICFSLSSIELLHIERPSTEAVTNIHPSNMHNRFHPYFGNQSMRVNCGELRLEHVGRRVEIVGHIQKQFLGRFMVLRDVYGSTQIVIPQERTDLSKRLSNMPLHSYIAIIGCVVPRPPMAMNNKMTTGEVEVSVQDIVMVKINKSEKMRVIESVGGFKQTTRQFSTLAQLDKSLTSDEILRCGQHKNLVDIFKSRTDTCGSLNKKDVGREVTIVGWTYNRNHLPRFLQLRDGYGIIQCLLPFNDQNLLSIANSLENGTIVKINATVRHRPESQINMFTSNGDIELLINGIQTVDSDTHIDEHDTIQQSVEEQNVPEPQEKDLESRLNSFTWRTHSCGELRIDDAGKKVTLCGWLQHKRMGRFFTLRDSYGSTQCFIDSEKDSSGIDNISLESIIKVNGTVTTRPQKAINPSMSTGEVEVLVETLEVLNKATYTPMPVRSFQNHKEPLRLQHRYIDLRFPEMQHNLRLRSTMLMNMRKYLIDSNHFVEVETPTLFCRTPGGAQEFVVPTRQKNQFYSLVQSPQQFKQMLMAGAVDRYFQVARCYRDETVRGDRQPEFTQLDIELSFAGVDEVLDLIEGLLRFSWSKPLSPGSFRRLTYRHVLETYGSDKPITSYDLKLQNLNHIIKKENKLMANITDLSCYGFVIKDSKAKLSNTQMKNLREEAKKKYPLVVIQAIHEVNIEDVKTKLNKLLDGDETDKLIAQLNLNSNDFLVLAIGSGDDTCLALGDVRLKVIENKELVNDIKKTGNEDDIFWVVEFPLFTKGHDGALETCHHPFTAPHSEDIALLDSDPLKVRSLSYDLVYNGNEIGGGSVRAHDGQLQRKLLDMLKMPHKPLEHFLHALDSGCPPHAGIALGIDRLVSIACNAKSIRDVIAFPKSHEGRDPLSGAPAAISDDEKKIYHINIAE